MMIRITVLCLASAVCMPAFAQSPRQAPAPTPAPAVALAFPPEVLAAAQQLGEQALKENEAYDLVAALTTEIGPRPAGSENDARAVAWALAKLKSLGFSNVHAEPVTVPHWVRGEIEANITAPFPQRLAAIALGGSVGTPDEGIEAPVVMIADLADLKARPPQEIEGKIVFFRARMARTRDGSGYGETVKIRVDGPAEAARLGAAAVVIRSVGTDYNRLAHTGMTEYADGVRKIPAAAISNPDADTLEREFEYEKPVTLRLRLTARELPEAASANVIGEIPGDTGEIVLLGAHLDSWDPGAGAEDDGAGVAIVTEAARRIGGLPHKPRRTIRVLLYANEEFGLSGAKTYAQAHAAELERHIVAMEADHGSRAVYALDSDVPEAALPVVRAITEALKPFKIVAGKNGAEGGADVGELRARGVPLLAPQQDGTFYFDIHHTANDTLDKVDWDGLNQCVAVYAVTAYLAAQYGPGFGRVTATPKEPAAQPGNVPKP